MNTIHPGPHRNSFLSNRPEPSVRSSPPRSPAAEAPSEKIKFVPPPPNSLAFTSIPVLDLQRAQAFYSAVFSWTVQPQTSSNQLIFFTPSSILGALSLVSAPDGPTTEVAPRAGGVVNYTLVQDVEATLQKVAMAGGKVVKGKWVEGAHTELGQFCDTEGNLGGVLRWLI